MPADSMLDLVVFVETGKANASIKSINVRLSPIESTALSATCRVPRGIGGMTTSIITGATAVNVLAGAIEKALSAANDFSIDSVMLAAENARARHSLNALATAYGVGAAAAAEQVAPNEVIGFEYTEAAHTVSPLVIFDLELSKAQGLAKLAKDAATVQNIAGTVALWAIVMAVGSGASRELRAPSLFLDFQKKVEMVQFQLGRALAEAEEKQPGLNAVLREGAKIRRMHAAVAQNVAAQLGASQRELKSLRGEIGARFEEDPKARNGHFKRRNGKARQAGACPSDKCGGFPRTATAGSQPQGARSASTPVQRGSLGIDLDGGCENLLAQQDVAVLRRECLQVEFDGLADISQDFLKRSALCLAAPQFRTPGVVAVLVLLDDHARLPRHDSSALSVERARVAEHLGRTSLPLRSSPHHPAPRLRRPCFERHQARRHGNPLRNVGIFQEADDITGVQRFRACYYDPPRLKQRPTRYLSGLTLQYAIEVRL